MSELLPCPFCGGNPFWRYEGGEEKGGKYSIICESCNMKLGYYHAYSLLKRWNTRTPLAEKSEPDTFAKTDPQTHWQD